MKREAAPPTYDSDSTETDEETVSIRAPGARTSRVKSEAPATIASVAAAREPRQQAQIPATSVLDLRKPSFQPPPVAAQPYPISAREFSNSILDLLVAAAPPVAAAPVEVTQPFVHHQQYPAPPQYEPPAQSVLPPQYPAHPATAATVSIVPHVAPGAETATASAGAQPIVIDVEDDGKCSMCELPFSNNTILARGGSEETLKCACCQRVLVRLESFTKSQRTKPEDEIRCKTCSRGGAEILQKIRDRPGSAYSIEMAAHEVEEAARKEKMRIALEKRRATIARKKQEKLEKEREAEKEMYGEDEEPKAQGVEETVQPPLQTTMTPPSRPARLPNESPPQQAPSWDAAGAGIRGESPTPVNPPQSRQAPQPVTATAAPPPAPIPASTPTFTSAQLDAMTDEELLDAQVEVQGDKCGCCRQKMDKPHAITKLDKATGLRCACCQRKLTRASFSVGQLAKESDLRRCRACVDGGEGKLSKIRDTTPPGRARTVVLNLEKLKITLEKRRATIARKKLEKQQEEEEEKRQLEQLGEAVVPNELAELVADRKEMELALRNILRDHRSIIRRRAVNDLDGPYRETYELELLEEEEKLHMQAVALRLENEVLYDDVCRELEVVDGAVRYGERDFEQGENDLDKPTAKQQKKAKQALQMMESGHALLKAAKATAIRQREEWNKRKEAPRGDGNGNAAQDGDEPERKRAKRSAEEPPNDPSLYTEKNSSPPPPMAITTRLRRRVARPIPEVIEIDDSD